MRPRSPLSSLRAPWLATRTIRRATALVALALGGLLAAACGGTNTASGGVASLGSTSSVATTTTAAAATQAAKPPIGADAVKFSSCMRKHGFPKFPMPQFGPKGSVSIHVTPGSGVNPKSPKFQQAQSFCRKYLPNGGVRPTITAQDQADYLKAVSCLRKRGFPNFPDPVFSNGGVRFVLPSGFDANSKAFVAARLVCQKLIPAGLPYSGGS